MDSREEAGTEVVVQIFVLTHFKHLFPFLHCHLVFNALSCLFLISEFFSSKLKKKNKTKNITKSQNNVKEKKFHFHYNKIARDIKVVV